MASGHPKRGRVTEQQLRCLQELKPFVVSQLEGDVVLNELYDHNILDKADRDRIRRAKNGEDLNRELVDTITMRTPAGFDAFVKALDDTGHTDAANEIRAKMRQLADQRQDTLSKKTSRNTRTPTFSPGLPSKRNERGDVDQSASGVQLSFRQSRENAQTKQEIPKPPARITEPEVLDNRQKAAEKNLAAETETSTRNEQEAKSELKRFQSVVEEQFKQLETKMDELKQEKDEKIRNLEWQFQKEKEKGKEMEKLVQKLREQMKEQQTKLNELKQEKDQKIGDLERQLQQKEAKLGETKILLQDIKRELEEKVQTRGQEITDLMLKISKLEHRLSNFDETFSA